MATTYPVDILNPEGTEVKLSGQVNFTSSSNAPIPSANPVTSGTLPQLAAWVSGTAQQNPVTRPITVALAISDDATNNAATVVVAVSPDNTTYTTLATVTLPAAINNLGAETLLNCVPLPVGWYMKLTIGAHATVAQSSYY
jgi:hypothetical protein